MKTPEVINMAARPLSLHHIDIGDQSIGHVAMLVPCSKEEAAATRDKLLTAYNNHTNLKQMLHRAVRDMLGDNWKSDAEKLLKTL